MKLVKIFLPICLLMATLTHAQETIELYSAQIPNSKISSVKEESDNGIYKGVTIPTLEIFLPEKDKANGTGVIICPGGGYAVIVYEAEGIRTAKEFAKHGIAAFILKYRLPNDSSMLDKKNGPLQDALQAMKIVRENTEKWNLNKNKIGIMGFSAGGHLASTAATHFDMKIIENAEGINLRPDFQILIYPVISMREILTHKGSRYNLLGDNPTEEITNLFSNELQVNEKTPPAYITHTGDDVVVTVDNSLEYYKALQKFNIPTEIHIYPKGNHGFVLSQITEKWMEPIINWLNINN